jgi:osmoprotectant transport system substrate-binding protein
VKYLTALPIIAALALGVTACGSSTNTATPRVSSAPTSSSTGLPSTGGKGSIKIGAANFPENGILAEVYKQALAHAGYEASVVSLTTRPNIVTALEKGGIQVEPDYVGSLTEYFNKAAHGPNVKPVASGDLDATTTAAKAFAMAKGLKVLTPSLAADQNAFVVTRAFSTKNSVTKLSDLAAYKGSLVLGGTPECKTYPLCQPGLEKLYGLHFTGFQQTDLGGTLSVSKLKSGAVTLGEYLSSDGSVKANDFVVLEDDKHLQAVDNVVPVLASSVAQDPLVAQILDAVSAAMTTEDLIALNAEVSIDRKLPAQAATDFLTAKHLL